MTPMATNNFYSVIFGDGQGVYDANGNEQLLFGQTADAVNYLKLTNSAAGDPINLSALGDDDNIPITITPKGTGNVIIGATTEESQFPSTLHIVSTTQNILTLEVNNNDNDYQDPQIDFVRSRGTYGTPLIVQDDDELGTFRFRGYDGQDYEDAAKIQVLVDGEPHTGEDTTDMPGRLEFSTTPDGADSVLKRMVILSTGVIEIYDAGTTLRYTFGTDGTAEADVAWNTFSPKVEGEGKELLNIALEDANKPVKPYEGIPVKKADDELFDIVPTEYQEEVDKLDKEGNPVLDKNGKPVKETVTKIKDVKVFRERRPNEFKTEEEVQAEYDKYAKCPAKITIASAKYLEYLTGVIDAMQAKIDELEARIELLEQKEKMK